MSRPTIVVFHAIMRAKREKTAVLVHHAYLQRFCTCHLSSSCESRIFCWIVSISCESRLISSIWAFVSSISTRFFLQTSDQFDAIRDNQIMIYTYFSTASSLSVKALWTACSLLQCIASRSPFSEFLSLMMLPSSALCRVS